MSGRRRSHTPRSTQPLRTADAATAVIDLAATSPLTAETVCLLTDDAHQPVSCIVVEGGGLPDDVFAVAELVQELGRSSPVAHVVLASCRPGYGYEPGDADRWHELAAGFAEAGLDLLEWFIRDEHLTVAVTPLVSEVPRWPGR